MNATTTPEREAALPELIGDEEVCKALGRSRQTLARYVRNGEVPAPRILGRKRYWTREAIASFLRGAEANQPTKRTA